MPVSFCNHLRLFQFSLFIIFYSVQLSDNSSIKLQPFYRLCIVYSFLCTSVIVKNVILFLATLNELFEIFRIHIIEFHIMSVSI